MHSPPGALVLETIPKTWRTTPPKREKNIARFVATSENLEVFGRIDHQIRILHKILWRTGRIEVSPEMIVNDIARGAVIVVVLVFLVFLDPLWDAIEPVNASDRRKLFHRCQLGPVSSRRNHHQWPWRHEEHRSPCYWYPIADPQRSRTRSPPAWCWISCSRERRP